MHVWVRPQHPAAVAVFAKSGLRMRELALERSDQGVGARLPAAPWIERAMTAGVSQQCKGLVVEVERRINDAAVPIHGRDHAAVALHKSLTQKIERMAAGLAPASVPAEAPRFAVAKRLSSGDPRPPGRNDRPAVKIDSLVIASQRMIGADAPPKRQRIVKQPATQFFCCRCELTRDGHSRFTHSQ